MPVYVYRREDGTEFEYRQPFGDETLTECPDTGQGVVRIIKPINVVYKSLGFYKVDKRRETESVEVNE